jgi:hypothetical protein
LALISTATAAWDSALVPLPERYREQLRASYGNAARQARRDAIVAFLRYLLEVVVVTAIGLVIIGMAFATFDLQLGRVYWFGGMVVWLLGLIFVSIRAYRRAEDRGDVGRPT